MKWIKIKIIVCYSNETKRNHLHPTGTWWWTNNEFKQNADCNEFRLENRIIKKIILFNLKRDKRFTKKTRKKKERTQLLKEKKGEDIWHIAGTCMQWDENWVKSLAVNNSHCIIVLPFVTTEQQSLILRGIRWSKKIVVSFFFLFPNSFRCPSRKEVFWSSRRIIDFYYWPNWLFWISTLIWHSSQPKYFLFLNTLMDLRKRFLSRIEMKNNENIHLIVTHNHLF